MSLATLIGAIFGTALFNAIAFAVARRWPTSIAKIVVIGLAMFLILGLADNAVRVQEPMGDTLLRVGIAQLLVSLGTLFAYFVRTPTAS